MPHSLITGVAGFIGSHLADTLLQAGHQVSGVDNFVRGRRENLPVHSSFHFYERDLSTESGCMDALSAATEFGPVDSVWHLAANSDIQAGVADPSIDLRDTFLTTFHLLGAMRRFGAGAIIFASSSAVYGVHNGPLSEETGQLFPISNYGAMKLASEGVITAAVESFLSRADILRFPNVVGGRATHGVVFDFLAKLRQNPGKLPVLGNGSQQKPYLHVSELIDAMIFIREQARERINCFNISVADEGATVRSIAETVVQLAAPGTRICYEDGPRGWVGDVPKFIYNIDKLSTLGWRAGLTSLQAIERAARECLGQTVACNS